MESSSSTIGLKSLELHYYLENNSHSMNAVVKNKAEAELLRLLFEIAALLELDIEFEFEALKEGGIKSVIKTFNKKKTKKKLRNVAFFFGTIATGVLINVISDQINRQLNEPDVARGKVQEIIKSHVDSLDRDDITTNGQQLIIGDLINQLGCIQKVQVFKSRYYQQILKEPRVYQLSLAEVDENNKSVSNELMILRPDFGKQIVNNEDLEPLRIENANIQIVSPVLGQANIKWKGIYNSIPISFNMQDSEFKNSVLNGQYSFSHGTSIRCNMEIIMTINENGDEVLKEAKVLDVLEVFIGAQSVETKKSKQLKELQKQGKFDFGE